MNPLELLYGWLRSHPGGRLIVSADGFELCARNLEGLTPDDDRFASREGADAFTFETLHDVLDEMDDWEAAGWEYED